MRNRSEILRLLDQLVATVAALTAQLREGLGASPVHLHVEPVAGAPVVEKTFGDLWVECLLAAIPKLPRLERKPTTLAVVVRGLRRYIRDHTCTPPSSEALAKELGLSKDAVQACIAYLRATYWLQNPKNNPRQGKGWRLLTYQLDIPAQYLPPDGPRPPRPARKAPVADELAVHEQQLDALAPPGPAPPSPEPIPLHPVPPDEVPHGTPSGGTAFYEGSPATGHENRIASLTAMLPTAVAPAFPVHVELVAGGSGYEPLFDGLISGYESPIDSLFSSSPASGGNLTSSNGAGDWRPAPGHVPTGGSMEAGEYQAFTAMAARESGWDTGGRSTESGQHSSTRGRAPAYASAFPLEKPFNYLLLLLGEITAREGDEDEDSSSMDRGEREKRQAQAAMVAQTREWLDVRSPDSAPPGAATTWDSLVRDGLMPLIAEFENPAWRRQGERQPVAWWQRPTYWKQALRFLARGQSKDPEAAVKYALTRVDAPLPGTEHERVHAQGGEGSKRALPQLDALAPVDAPVSKMDAWIRGNPEEHAQLRAAAVERLGGPEKATPAGRVLIEVSSMVGEIVHGRATVAGYVSEAEKRREMRLAACSEPAVT